MGLANLANVPRDDAELLVFSFSNQDEHFRVAQAVKAQKNVSTPIYPVDPINFWALGVWLQNHQQMHNNINGILGTPGSDLTDVDFRNRAQLESWIWLHFTEHQNWSRALGL